MKGVSREAPTRAIPLRLGNDRSHRSVNTAIGLGRNGLEGLRLFLPNGFRNGWNIIRKCRRMAETAMPAVTMKFITTWMDQIW